MKISELILKLESKKKEYGDVEVETQVNETVVLVIEGEGEKPEMVEYIPILSYDETSMGANPRKIRLKLGNQGNSVIKQ